MSELPMQTFPMLFFYDGSVERIPVIGSWLDLTPTISIRVGYYGESESIETPESPTGEIVGLILLIDSVRFFPGTPQDIISKFIETGRL